MLFSYTLCIAAGLCVYWIAQRARTKATHRLIVEREGCQSVRCLPNKWFPPFGLDKLGKVIEAEKTKTYPLLMLAEHEKYGDTYAQWGGPMYTVITRDTENIRAVVSSDFSSFEVGDGRHGCVRPLLGDGIFTQDGRQWERSRKLLAPMLQRPTLPDLRLFEKHFQYLRAAIVSEGQSSDHSARHGFDMRTRLLDLSFSTIAEFLLGSDADSGGTGVPWMQAFAVEFNTAMTWISRRERLKAFHWMVDGFGFRRSCRAAQSLVDDLLRRAVEVRKAQKLEDTPSETYVAFETLLHQQTDIRLIRDQFMNLLLAGKDTSGSFLCWMFYALAREPQLAKDLSEEIDSILGNDMSRAPDKKELGAMVKLDRFICETLRLFPPVPINGRFSTRDTSLPRGGGRDGRAPILVPKDTLVAFSTFATQRNKDLYGEEASEFRTERWNAEFIKERKMVDWSYHAFLGGPRKCLGERFAITQAKYLLCRFLQHYHSIAPVDDTGIPLPSEPTGTWVDGVKYHVGLAMSPAEGIWLRFEARS